MKTRASRKKWVILLVIILAAAYAGWALNRPLPELKPEHAPLKLQITTLPGKLDWPESTQAAVGILGSNGLETHGAQTPSPTASTAKMITALMVVKKKPLKLGQQGPDITLTASDEASYNKYLAEEGSVVGVNAGMKLSEYQMLQAMLLPSANNIADSLAIWSYGSLANYSVAANSYLKQQGIDQTHVGNDASGFDDSSTSTAGDLVKIGKLLMQNQVLAQIVAQKSADIPGVGTVENVNTLLGSNGVIGIKTGNTDKAGGVFVGAADTMVSGRPVTIVTSLIGTSDLFQAMNNTVPLIQTAQANFRPVLVIEAGEVVGNYNLPWGGRVPAVASRSLLLIAWNGSTVNSTVSLSPISKNAASGQKVGQLSAEDPITRNHDAVDVTLDGVPTKPSALWRLTHPLD